MLVGGAMAGLAFVAVVGLAHTPLGRPLLRWLPGMGTSCPAGHEAMTLAERDRVRRDVLVPLRGEAPAASRRALAFELGTTGHADALAWSHTHALACIDAGARLDCTDVPASALDGHVGADAIHLEFDEDGMLIAVEAVHRTDDAARAAELFHGRVDRIDAAVGPARAQSGAPERLARGPLSQAAADYGFSDLRARVIATNLGHGRFVVREHWQGID